MGFHMGLQLSEQQTKHFVKQRFSRRSFGRLATILGAGAALRPGEEVTHLRPVGMQQETDKFKSAFLKVMV